jgi:hypothetical protein
MAITYMPSWLFLRSLERGGVSELGLAQSEDSFPASDSNLPYLSIHHGHALDLIRLRTQAWSQYNPTHLHLSGQKAR